jgi:hypothetical protein
MSEPRVSVEEVASQPRRSQGIGLPRRAALVVAADTGLTCL